MRKVEYKVTIICPFRYCRADLDYSRMSASCLECKSVELKEEKVSEVVILDENSKEQKDYEEKYKHCYEE